MANEILLLSKTLHTFRLGEAARPFFSNYPLVYVSRSLCFNIFPTALLGRLVTN